MLEIKQLTRLQIIRYCAKLEEENQTLKANIEFLHSCLDDREGSIELMKEENRKLKEDINVLEKAKFEVMAYIDICHPKTYLEAAKLQKMKEMYERIYNEKLYLLEKENNELKEEIGKLFMKH